jgi:hypothetical protein
VCWGGDPVICGSTALWNNCPRLALASMSASSCLCKRALAWGSGVWRDIRLVSGKTDMGVRGRVLGGRAGWVEDESGGRRLREKGGTVLS